MLENKEKEKEKEPGVLGLMPDPPPNPDDRNPFRAGDGLSSSEEEEEAALGTRRRLMFGEVYIGKPQAGKRISLPDMGATLSQTKEPAIGRQVMEKNSMPEKKEDDDPEETNEEKGRDHPNKVEEEAYLGRRHGINYRANPETRHVGDATGPDITEDNVPPIHWGDSEAQSMERASG
ncbi:hypothetical protein AAFF_G00302970 [Aldrovandia affinis]|uniref:Uncharacterized protein n=1 Tax=Aldrovandia affinis TaxID=143900 RepID=A0AAD7W144_9TELE|nr:hypothetical protein AAFF_G00302970 [Aldrovandia affinis]